MRKIIMVALILCIVSSSIQLVLQIIDHQSHISDYYFYRLGDQFEGLKSVLGNVRAIGYYTDKNIEKPLVIAQFEQAQYTLAPTVLDLNHTNYPLVIFDCSSPEVALSKIKELGFQPIKANSLGVILALNPHVSSP